MPAIVAACAVLSLAAPASRAATTDEVAGKIVYQWNPAAFRPAEGNPWKAEQVTLPDATVAASITSTGSGFNNYLFAAKGKLLSGRAYTAIIRYEITTPARFPDSFYLFARSSKLGQSRDVWHNWNGDAGTRGVAKLPISLKGGLASDDWAIYGGCKGPGTMVISSFEVREGRDLEYLPATSGGEPAGAPADTGTGTTLPTGAEPAGIDPPAPKDGLTLSAADFGLTADGPAGRVSVETAQANFQAIAAALKACKERAASVLAIPKGIYRFHSNAPIPVTDLSDLVIDGNGSEFIFGKLRTGVEAFSIQRCQRLVLRDLTLDWDWDVMPIASLARVLSISADGRSYEMTFPDLDARQVELAAKAPWTYLIPMDPVTLTRGAERFPISIASIEPVNPATLRVTTKSPVPVKVGATYCARHLYYNFEGFKVGFSSHLVFEGITIHSMPGMGWLGTGDMHHWKLSRCRIARREGSRHPLTTAADGFHVSQSQGDLTIEDCEFTGSGDDSVNIHDNCFQGVRRIDDTTLSLVNCPPYRLRLQEGDTVELFRGTYEPLGYRPRVKSVVYKNPDTILTLSDPLPADLSALSIILNRRYGTRNVRISGCRFHDTNGRSILLSARDSTIENCVFRNAIGTAVQFHTEIVGQLWSEGSGASNVIVRGNTFENTSYEGRYENAVVYAGAKLPTGITSYPLFHDLLIEKNHFINCSGPAVSLISASDVIVRGNLIESRQPATEANDLTGTILASHSKALALGGNTWKPAAGAGKAGVMIDPETTASVAAPGNVILK